MQFVERQLPDAAALPDDALLIDLPHRPLAAAFDDLEPSIQYRGEARPRRAEPGVDNAAG
jgi:hypothetical protein